MRYIVQENFYVTAYAKMKIKNCDSLSLFCHGFDELRTYFLIETPCREGFEEALDLNEGINEAINTKRYAYRMAFFYNY